MVTIRATPRNYCGCRRHMNQDYLKGEIAEWLKRDDIHGRALWKYDHPTGQLVFLFDSMSMATAFKLTFG